MKRYLCVTVGLALVGCAEGAPAPSTPDVTLDGDLIREHMIELSSDSFLGRGPGQPGGDLAADYIANRFADYGLEPVDGSYFQPVPMIGYTTDPTSVSLSFRGPDGALSAPYMDGFVLNPGDPQATEASGSAEVVFVGYGVDAPENDWNDFAGADVRGKFILILVNDPPATAEEPDLFGGRAMTYYGRWTYKWEEAARQGALGALIVHETEPAGYPWSVVRGGRTGEQFALPHDPAAPEPAGMVGWVTRDVAARILALGG
ncbi:MAG TPA: hypothetical protein VJ997_07810, partial [Longimicrobiales bacterium]|nr:hypothetical protein [Longimicrobiales bacterium]